MCGIIAYTGRKRAAPVLYEGLKRLEYRGYDSAGMATVYRNGFLLIRRKGRVKELEEGLSFEGNAGIGHTRWATHGLPIEKNAHPHIFQNIAVAHNGIIENYLVLKRECVERGEKFSSDTDSEVIAHLVVRYEEAYGDLLSAVEETIKRLAGSYAIAVLDKTLPNEIVLAAKDSPLIVGIGDDGCYAASDVPALSGKCGTFYALYNGETARITREGAAFFKEGKRVQKQTLNCGDETEFPRKEGYPNYMFKEMMEIPEAVCRSMIDFSLPEYAPLKLLVKRVKRLHIVACGTAYHSALAAKHAIETLARVPVEAYIASEYRYNNPVIERGTAVVAVSQSGETADTIAAAERAKEKGAPLVALTNTPCSTLSRFADFTLITRAGREVGVAATKSYNAQLAALDCLAVAMAKEKGFECNASIENLADCCKQAQKACDAVREWTPYFVNAKSVYFLGRGADYCTALEGSLKLKEISYLPSEGYPAGELKHGTLALIDEKTPVVVILTQKALMEKSMNAVHEVYARGGKVFLVTCFEECLRCKEVTKGVLIPKCWEVFSPIVSVMPLQRLAYEVCIARGNDPDKPRNLAKSVTVE